MQYSVSPRLNLISFLPNPMLNVFTFTLFHLATMKWPSS